MTTTLNTAQLHAKLAKTEDYRKACEAALARFADTETFPRQCPSDFATILQIELKERGLNIARRPQR